MTYDPPARRGKLRIYLGSAPGVGKTYAMLGEGRRRADRGTDVVVGLVETHGRPKTQALVGTLEVVPRRQITYRDNEFGELDTDAVLARKPAVVLVDELAHTNVPGSRHEKRWQDIDDLLAAGIDVLSTVNVQHLESLNDVVEKITGVRQRETVPDQWVRGAEQVELVDITPEALRRRMAHGNIYPPEKIDAALSNYFKPVNLVALRELALLWVADEVDVALQRYRAEQQITDVWEARERIVVAVTGGPESETVLRRAARIAKRSGGAATGRPAQAGASGTSEGRRADLLCVHVLRGDGLAGAPPQALTRLRKLADGVGASFHTVVGGEDVPAALLDFARGVNATQLVLGTSRRSRVARLFNEGIGATVVQDSGPIDVHMVTHQEAGGGTLVRRVRSALSPTRRTAGWLCAPLLPGLATVTGVLGKNVFGLSTDVVLFFLATVLVALVGGLGPALLAAVAGGLLLNYFLTPPLYTFTIAEQQNVITLVVMVVVAIAVALVVDRAARRSEQAAVARTEAALLASFARTVLTRADPLPRLLEKVGEAFGLPSVAVLEHAPDVPNGWRTVACTSPPDCLRPEDAEVDVAVDVDVHLIGRGRPLAAADRRVLETVGGQALLALRAQRMAAEAAEARRQAEGGRLRSALLSAVGHDLRTPLTSIKAAAGSLRDAELRLSEADRAELLATVEESVDRLTALVDNLLDSSRLAAGAVVPRPRAVGYDEAVTLALAGVEGAYRVKVEIDESLPDVLADAGLLERVVANVVDNALRHGAGAPVAVRASAHADRVELRVVDSGPGVPRSAADGLFQPFQRLGDRDATTGVGLGLSVAKGFTTAMGGTLVAEDTPGGGLTVVISLPEAGT
ncbi:two-component system sensor histidine kinase KdpD [Pseudonocardia eucalypti]|nr:two-component system sensor histidine kinase KdpD [Pseudonocardia eucalypti]